MEQQQIRVRLPLGTKLIFITVLLLLATIGFLGYSSVRLLTKDKLAYTYDTQSTQTALIGRSIRGDISQAIDVLRLSLASDFGNRQAALQSLADNQTMMPVFWVGHFTPATQSLTDALRLSRKADPDAAAEAAELPTDVPAEALAAMAPDLAKDGFALAALDARKPTAYVLVAFTGAPGADRVELAVGVLNFSGAINDVRGNDFFISTRSGRPLMTSMEQFGTPSRDPLFAAASKNQLRSGAIDYTEEGTRYLGSFEGPGYGLVVGIKVAWKRAMQSMFSLIERFILLGLMTIGVAAALAVFFARTITAPIRGLYDGTLRIAEGDFDIHLPVEGRDEMGALSHSFNTMSSKINTLLEEGKEKVKLENELAIASTVQQTLIPEAEFRSPDISISGYYESASQCGGDWWGHFSVGRQHCIMIADATGHGLPSALITAAARSCFSVMQKLAEEDSSFSFSPEAMLRYANRVIYDAAGGKIMMTFFVGVFDYAEGKLRYANAGHNPPWMFRREDGKVILKSLMAKGMRLGESPDLQEVQEKAMDVAPGDLFFFYTDGLIEGQNHAGEQFGKKRARRLVEESADREPREIISHVMNDFHLHNEGKPFDDDVTVAVARIGDGQSGGAGGV